MSRSAQDRSAQSIDYRRLLTYELIGRKEVAAKASHRPENVLTLYQDANAAGVMADAVLATRIPDLCPDCEPDAPTCVWSDEMHDWDSETGQHRCPQCFDPCTHPNAPTIADRFAQLEAIEARAAALGVSVDDLLRWGENVAKLQSGVVAMTYASHCNRNTDPDVYAERLLAALRTEAEQSGADR